MAPIEIQLQILPHGRGLPLPEWQTPGAAGADLHAAVNEPVDLAPGERIAIPTGLIMALPMGWEAQVRPRSGLALRQGLTVLNSPGTVDADYRGEVRVMLVNLGQDVVRIERGARIAQLVLAPVTRARWTVVAEVADDTERGTGGFGSTGGGVT